MSRQPGQHQVHSDSHFDSSTYHLRAAIRVDMPVEA